MRLRQIVSAALAIAVLLALAALVAPRRVDRIAGAAEAIDGDSLRLRGENIRLEGIDAPELRQTCRRGGVDEPCGREARAALAALLRAGPLDCTVSGRDRYRRPLATCRAGAVEVNREMVREGWAIAYGDYEAEEAEARRRRRGLWAMTFERPADWRAQRREER